MTILEESKSKPSNVRMLSITEGNPAFSSAVWPRDSITELVNTDWRLGKAIGHLDFLIAKLKTLSLKEKLFSKNIGLMNFVIVET